jgi:hypothetical protein
MKNKKNKKPKRPQRCKTEECNRIIGSRKENKSGLCYGCSQKELTMKKYWKGKILREIKKLEKKGKGSYKRFCKEIMDIKRRAKLLV